MKRIATSTGQRLWEEQLTTGEIYRQSSEEWSDDIAAIEAEAAAMGRERLLAGACLIPCLDHDEHIVLPLAIVGLDAPEPSEDPHRLCEDVSIADRIADTHLKTLQTINGELTEGYCRACGTSWPCDRIR